MSKSYDNTLELFMPEKPLKKRVNKIVTDSIPVADPKDPNKCNLFAIISLFMDEAEKGDLAERYLGGGLKYSDVKKELFSRIWEYFDSARQKRRELEQNPNRVREILQEGAKKARMKALPTLQLARDRVGLVY